MRVVFLQSMGGLHRELIRASKDGDLSKVKYLVEVCHVDPHSCRDYENDATPLHWATLYGHLDVVRYLVEERNCDVNLSATVHSRICQRMHGLDWDVKGGGALSTRRCA